MNNFLSELDGVGRLQKQSGGGASHGSVCEGRQRHGERPCWTPNGMHESGDQVSDKRAGILQPWKVTALISMWPPWEKTGKDQSRHYLYLETRVTLLPNEASMEHGNFWLGLSGVWECGSGLPCGDHLDIWVEAGEDTLVEWAAMLMRKGGWAEKWAAQRRLWGRRCALSRLLWGGFLRKEKLVTQIKGHRGGGRFTCEWSQRDACDMDPKGD